MARAPDAARAQSGARARASSALPIAAAARPGESHAAAAGSDAELHVGPARAAVNGRPLRAEAEARTTLAELLRGAGSGA
jgi:hypothetical protein